MNVIGKRNSGLAYMDRNSAVSARIRSISAAGAPRASAAATTLSEYALPKSNPVASVISQPTTQNRLATALMPRPTPSAGRKRMTPPSTLSR